MKEPRVPLSAKDLVLIGGMQIHPYVKYVVDKFKKKLPKDDLKRYAKEVRQPQRYSN